MRKSYQELKRMTENTESAKEHFDLPVNHRLMSPSDGLYKTHLMSRDLSSEETIYSVRMARERLELFLSTLDALNKENISPEVLTLLSVLADLVQVQNERLTALEEQNSKRLVSSRGMNWRDRLVLAEFRITENDGCMLQRDLQRILGIKSRTTMSYLVDLLTSSGQYRKHKKGRNNIIERVE